MRTAFAPLFLLFMTAMTATGNAAPAPHRNPVAVGTFIQQYLVQKWTDAQWMAEYRAMKAVGMRYLIFGTTADSKAKVTFYPTAIPGYRLADGYTDPVDACLRNAEKAGIHVFLGLNFNEDWWVKSARDPEWLYGQMQDGNAVATELFQRYHAKYPKAFAGWYWVWEVDNLNFREPERRAALAKALSINVDHVKSLAPDLPVMLCPFMNEKVGTPDAYRDMWEDVFAHSSLGKGDIFAPQDCVGAGGLTIDNVDAWFAALKKAVDSKPGLRFWCDTETFIQEDWTSAPLDRFVRQMKIVQPYVEACVTFAYSHYYSPNKVDPGFQRTYLGYVRTGALETVPPTAPANVRAARLPDGRFRLQWKKATDNIGICGYYVYKGGRLVSRQQQEPKTEYTEPKPKGNAAPAGNGTQVFEVQSYDFAGNTSAKVRATMPPA